MNTDSFIMHIKNKDVYEDIANDVVKAFDTSNHEIKRPFSIGKNEKVIRLMKDELGGKVMKSYSYLIDDHSEDK